MVTVLTGSQNLEALICFSVYRTIVVLRDCFVVVDVQGVLGPILYCLCVNYYCEGMWSKLVHTIVNVPSAVSVFKTSNCAHSVFHCSLKPPLKRVTVAAFGCS